MTERICIISAAFVLDMIFGDPYWLYHPVRLIGAAVGRTEQILWNILHICPEREVDRRKKKIAGLILVIIVLCLSTGVPLLLLLALQQIHPWLRIVAETFMCYQLLAMKSLKTESMKVYAALKAGDVEKARHAVSMIVGRDTEALTEEGIVKAAVETVAENTSDGVIAPMLFMMLFGVAGGFFYKAANTMDSMVGYKNDRYLYFGRCAARLDDLLNLIPARVSAAGMIAASFFLRLDWKNAVKIYRRDRYSHASPNSAHTEAVCAGALSVQLAGDAYYFGKLCRKPFIGDALRCIEIEDIKLANRLLYGVSFIIWALGVLIIALFFS